MRAGHWGRWLPGLPIATWARAYDRDTLSADLLAAVIVTLMLIPQSLAYAMLAGLPPETGLYASVLPLVLYGILGSSRVLAVGPVAVVSLMTAAAVGAQGGAVGAATVQNAVTLAFLSGAMLSLMGLLRFGQLANFLSHPVISGFVSASALLIATGQLKTMLGLPSAGQTMGTLLGSLPQQMHLIHVRTMLLGGTVALTLAVSRRYLQPLLMRAGMARNRAAMASKTAPALIVVAATLLCWWLQWHHHGVGIVGSIPQSLPPLSMPTWDLAVWQQLAMPALLISIIGFVESVSVAQTLAAKRRQRIEPDQELVALGASNLAASFSGGFPVTGGFARSVVNFDAGARTPAAGIFTALGILLASVLLTPVLYYLPRTALAATILVPVLSLVDTGVLRRTWRYSRSDFAGAVVTLLATLLTGVETGLLAGVALSLALYLYRTSRPHIALVGLVPGTEHFRNVLRHTVIVSPRLVSMRVDESLYFANARALEDRVNDTVASNPKMEHLVLQCSAVNAIDASALESLEAIDHRLRDAGMALHLSEVKGPVMDRLQRTGFLDALSGQVFLTHYQAIQQLTPEVLD